MATAESMDVLLVSNAFHVFPRNSPNVIRLNNIPSRLNNILSRLNNIPSRLNNIPSGSTKTRPLFQTVFSYVHKYVWFTRQP